MNKLISFCLALCFQISSYGQIDVFDAARTGDTLAIKAMVLINVDTVNSTNPSGHSALILACYNHQSEVVKLLLQNGADVNYCFSQGSAIHGASFKGHLDIIKLLAGYQAEIDQPDQNGSTPLIYATLFRHNEVASFLFLHGADPTKKDNTGTSALQYAQSLDNLDLLTLFKTTTK